MKQLKLALIGCGDRGSCYMHYLDDNPEKFKLVAVADPLPEKRQYFIDNYNVPAEGVFDDYKELLSKEKLIAQLKKFICACGKFCRRYLCVEIQRYKSLRNPLNFADNWYIII